MKVGLFDFQEDALSDLRSKLNTARSFSAVDNPQVISFSAPTGSGKTIVMTALFEDIFFGEPEFSPQPDAVILWISDMPELNEQTRLKIEGKSDRIRVRQLINIDSGFDSERLDGGHIYFINTQKLGHDKLLTRRGDSRQHPLWETITNTARAIPDRFYVVIDEAHRGMGKNTKDIEKARTILQKFLLGSSEDGLCKMPLVIGMSATPRRFEDLLSGTTHTIHKVYIAPDEVRESGLLKDRIMIHYPSESSQAEMTLLAEAAGRWKSIQKVWKKYCTEQKAGIVRPILVVQVQDGTENIPSKTDLSTAVSTIENSIGRSLKDGEIAHTFNDFAKLELNGRSIRRLDASRIQEDEKATVVFFKMSLSTGWDCPRAEVIMSFRRAQDHTYIAQLLGRMVRTPLARRVESDAELNDVHLFLPHYDQTTVQNIIQDLQNVEEVPPSEIGTVRDMVTLYRRPGCEDLFEAMNHLITYSVNAVRKQPSLHRIMKLGRGLTFDMIDMGAYESVKNKIVQQMGAKVQRLKSASVFQEKIQQISGIDINTIAVGHGSSWTEEQAPYVTDSVTADIDSLFEKSGILLGNGLHKEYWRAQQGRNSDTVKVEVIVLAQDHDSMKSLEKLAAKEFDNLYSKYKRDIAALKEPRRRHYERLRLATSQPQDIPWLLPESINFRRPSNAPQFEMHLFVEKDGIFRAELGTWENGVLEEELNDVYVVGWLRNLDRQTWSLEIPYRVAGDVKPFFPDIVVVRKDTKGYIFDILEPHDPSRKDNADKARGLAEFAEKHWDLFNRIQLIRRNRGSDGKERYFRLDVGNEVIRKKVLAVTGNNHLDQIFEQDAGCSS